MYAHRTTTSACFRTKDSAERTVDLIGQGVSQSGPRKLETMIYPGISRRSGPRSMSERSLIGSELSDRYDIFYSKRFVTDGVEKKADQVDFIVAIPEKALVCIESKGDSSSIPGPPIPGLRMDAS